jgi:CMP-N-acetylneuraminic acid synthetase
MVNGKTVTALLPMKAHSERVKNKNFKNIAGKPLFKWILENLLNIVTIDKIVINTDAIDILNCHGLYENEKVQFRARKKELCGDFVSMNDILFDDIKNVKSDVYIMTHTTNPLISSNTIKKALDTYLRNLDMYDSLFSVNKYQTRFYTYDGKAINHDPSNLIRTQDLESWYEENSCIYIFSENSFSMAGARIGEKPYLFETPKIESIDIDNKVDWNIAEIFLNFFK